MSEQPSDAAGQRAQPKQLRSVETYNSVLEAAAELFGQRGYEQTTTHQIAAAAGISVGALYRYFADKQAILMALYRREIPEMRQRLLEQMDLSQLVGQDIDEVVRRTLATAFRVYGERPGLRRVLGEQSRKIPELVALRRNHEAELHGAVEQILASVAAVQLPDREASAYLITLFMESLIDDVVLHQSKPEVEQQRLIAAGTDFILRYALGRRQEAAGRRTG